MLFHLGLVRGTKSEVSKLVSEFGVFFLFFVCFFFSFRRFFSGPRTPKFKLPAWMPSGASVFHCFKLKIDDSMTRFFSFSHVESLTLTLSSAPSASVVVEWASWVLEAFPAASPAAPAAAWPALPAAAVARPVAWPAAAASVKQFGSTTWKPHENRMKIRVTSHTSHTSHHFFHLLLQSGSVAVKLHQLQILSENRSHRLSTKNFTTLWIFLQKQLVLANHLRVLIWQKPCVWLDIGWCLRLWIPRQTTGWQRNWNYWKVKQHIATKWREEGKATNMYKIYHVISKFPKRFQNQRLFPCCFCVARFLSEKSAA